MSDVEPPRPTDATRLLEMIQEAVARNVNALHVVATGPNSRLLTVAELDELAACSRVLAASLREQRAQKPGDDGPDPSKIPADKLMGAARGGR